MNTKIIHYCWFGGKPLSELTLKCIESWKKYLPDFEIKEWNEKNFDVNQCTFIKEAYEQKKWAFVADYTRFKVLEQYGGLYLDTDMEITSDISKYLEHDLFFGKEDSKMINAAVVWSKKPNNNHIHSILQVYEESEVFNPTGDLFDQSVPKVLTNYFNKFDFNQESEEVQFLNNDVYIYPMEYFYPLSYDHQHNKFTKNSCMIHHFDATWTSKGEQLKTMLKRKNMGFLIYIIDFFVAAKNKVKSLTNYRDISIFSISLILLFIYYFIIVPGDKNIFDVLQIIILSFVLTFVSENVRTIELNRILDKEKENDSVTLFDIRRNKIKKDKYSFIFDIEKNIYLKQLIMTIIFILMPVVGFLTGLMTYVGFIYSISFLCMLSILYVGIINKFKFRILELVSIAFLLMLNQIYYANNILFSGITIVVLILFTLINKLSKKKMIAFIFSLIFFGILLFGFKVAFVKEHNVIENNSQYLYNFETVTIINEVEDNTLLNKLVNINESNNLIKNIMYNPTIILYITVALTCVYTFIKRNTKYVLLTLPIFLGFFNSVSDNTLIYTVYISLYYIVLILLTNPKNKSTND